MGLGYLNTNSVYTSFFICIAVLINIKIGTAQDQSFETNTPPNNWNASLGALSISSKHYKLGAKSLKWEWTANDVLTISDLQSSGLIPDEVQGYYKNMFRMWIYAEEAIATEKLALEFYDNTHIKQYYYDFNINFTGWRAASASYKNEMSGSKASDNLDVLIIKAPTTGSGVFYIDYIDYTMDRNTSRSADYQLTFINADNDEHWGDIVYCQSLPKTISNETPTEQELDAFNDVKSIYDNFILGSSPGLTTLASAVADYKTQEITYNNDIVTGLPLYGTDYSTSQTIKAIDDFIYVFARDYKHNNTATSLTYFLNTIRYILDQGYADGSLVETIHHIGYQFRNVAKSIHLMKDELETAGLWTQAQKMVEWYVNIDVIWHPSAFDSNMDDALTRSLPILGACLYKTEDAEKVQYLKGFKNYAETWLTPYAKEKNGLKIDYTGFHHDVYYPQYSFGAYKSLAQAVNYISGGTYGISTEKREEFKKVLSTARVLMSEDNFANSLSGRSPLNSISVSSAYKYLGLIAPVDEQLIGAYNYITGGDSDTSFYPTETLPNGFWQFNFSTMGVYRQGDWVADIKGFNKYFWGTEIYSSDNRYGRYQSYGAVEILYPGGFDSSGFDRNGWNWNMAPGTTSIHLPWSELVAESSRQDEKTDANFAASLRFASKENNYIDAKLEGEYGIFGMDFIQKDLSTTHNTTFNFKKSVFCFDGKIVCLGSNINNDDTSNNTATNLFQNKLTSTSTPIVVNSTSISNFPYNPSPLSNTSDHWIIDAYNTGYYIVKGSEIVISRANQTSPNEKGSGSDTTGDYTSAYIDHGTSPANAGYEYVVIPGTSTSDMSTFSTAMQTDNTAFYKVIQKDNTAHIVNYDNLYAYVLFESGTYGNTTPIKSNDSPCLVMTESIQNNLRLSIVQPDLNFADDNGSSQTITSTLVLNGDWSLYNSSGGNVQITAGSNQTTIQVDLKDGLPIDIELYSGVYNPFYPNFYYEDFRNNDATRGYQVQIVSNPDGQSESNLGKIISDIVDSSDSDELYDNSRPSVRIPANTERDQRAISIQGAGSGQNYKLEVWIPLTTVDLSSSNPYISQDDPNKYISFWTESRYANGGTSSLSVLMSTDYTNDISTATWTDLSPQLNQIAANDNLNDKVYLESILDISSYDSPTFTLAFKYTGDNSTYSSTNRNGIFYISDVKFYTSPTSLNTTSISADNTPILYPNPSNSFVNFRMQQPTSTITSIQLYNSIGIAVYSQQDLKPIDVRHFQKGIYFLHFQFQNGIRIYKQLIIK